MKHGITWVEHLLLKLKNSCFAQSNSLLPLIPLLVVSANPPPCWIKWLDEVTCIYCTCSVLESLAPLWLLCLLPPTILLSPCLSDADGVFHRASHPDGQWPSPGPQTPHRQRRACLSHRAYETDGSFASPRYGPLSSSVLLNLLKFGGHQISDTRSRHPLQLMEPSTWPQLHMNIP